MRIIQQLLIISTILMPERKVWTENEDTILRLLKQERNIKKWSQIAQIMNSQFKIKARTGKQCRERYHNHLDSAIITTEWTLQEQRQLIEAHEEVGNKWSLISQKLPGRTDNCVKNHFYSKLRKSTRKLNKILQGKYKKQLRQIKMSLLYKIIETTEERFKHNSKIDEQIIFKCINIKNKLFHYQQTQMQMENIKENMHEKLQLLIDDIILIDLKIKKTARSAKEHRSSTQTIYCKQLQQPIVKQIIEKEKTCEDPASDQFYKTFMRVYKEIIMENK